MWVKSREIVVLGNLQTVKLFRACLCVFFMAQFKGGPNTVMRLSVLPRFPEKDIHPLGESQNSEIVKLHA